MSSGSATALKTAEAGALCPPVGRGRLAEAGFSVPSLKELLPDLPVEAFMDLSEDPHSNTSLKVSGQAGIRCVRFPVP